MFDIGSRKWAGLTKIVEETGELNQVIGKLMGNRGENKHFDGSDLHENLWKEIADVYAALNFAMKMNDSLDEDKIFERVEKKYKRFLDWHKQNLEK